MAPSSITTLLLFISLLIISCFSSQVYVVYMGNKNSNSPDEVTLQNHYQLLSTVHGGSMAKAEESHVYSYSKGFRGFAAKLSEEQASHLAEMPGVVSVFPNTKIILHTTRSWDFMGLANGENAEIPGSSTKNQENVIIGFIDSGIWPESPSFSDEGMPPVPSRWRGQCQSGESFPDTTCNNKIIGAKYYIEGYNAEEQKTELIPTISVRGVKSARDSQGHGTHTASTAAGRHVDNINYGGLAVGAARGGAPMARIAVYKVCWEDGCYAADVLAAFDDAIGDGVDILSVSLGPGSPPADYFLDTVSVGSFHATSHGILVVASAGNTGPKGSAINVAPWMLTVGASTTDRNFASDIILDGGTKFTGEGVHTFQMDSPVPTILAADATAGGFTPDQSSFCVDRSLNEMASGKILVCRYSGDASATMMDKSVAVKNAGGVGMILIDESGKGKVSTFAIPAASVGRAVGEQIISYLKSTSGAKAIISPTRIVLGSQPAPRLAVFSSRGPNALTPEILKPDIMAPGLNILAAWTPAANYGIHSGTSMSCPHITGLAALIKAVNPSWSAAAIKSAIMTTATVLDKSGKILTADPGGNPANPFDFGSGFPDPTKVLNPGLVYDTDPSDYKAFLCSIGYDDSSLRQITGDGSTCVDQPASTPSDLNYPSIAVPNLKDRYSVTRTVTNVGKPLCLYRSVVVPPAGVNVTVDPKNILFRNYGDKVKFTVTFTSISPTSNDYVFGSLSWNAVRDGPVVTSPLVVRVATS